MNKYYITLESPDTPIVDLSKVAGVVEAFCGHEVDLSKYTNIE